MDKFISTIFIIFLALFSHNFFFLMSFTFFLFFLFYSTMALVNLKISNAIHCYNLVNGFPMDIQTAWTKKTIRGKFPPNWTSSREIPRFPLSTFFNLVHKNPKMSAFLFFSFLFCLSLLLAFFVNNCSVEFIASLKENSIYHIHIKIDENLFYMINGVFMLLNSLYIWLGINNFVQIIHSFIFVSRFNLPICYENGPKGVRLTVRSPPSTSNTSMRDRSPRIEKEIL